ncbi:MAG: Ig-like domain repeat protein [Chthonomonadales bacterium]|nr:Ig-like domain repeat protein [Chthonomonadales bacterium]
MRRTVRLLVAFITIFALAIPAFAGLDDSWDWPNDPATGKPRRKIRIKYGFPAGTKLGDKELKDVMDEAVANWNGVKGQTGWEFEVVGATDEADVEIVSEDHDRPGGAVTTWSQDKDGRVKPGTCKVKFDPTPPGYSWDEAGKNKDDTKNPVSCAKHELSHLLRLDHQGGTRSVSLKLKDPQGKDTKNDDVTTVSADDIDEAKKTSTLPIKKAAEDHPAGHDAELRVPAFPLETPEYPTPPDIPDIYLWAPDGLFLNPARISLNRRVINSCPDPFLVDSGLNGRLLKVAEIQLEGSVGRSRIMLFQQICLILPYEGGELGYGHLFDMADPDYGPLEELGIYPVVWNPHTNMWMRLDLMHMGGQFILEPATNRAILYLPSHLLNSFFDIFYDDLLVGLAAPYAPFGDALLVVPDPLLGGYGGTVILTTELPAPPGGRTFEVTSPDPFVVPPGRLFLPEGMSRVEGSLATTAPPEPRHVPIQASEPSGYSIDSFFDIFVDVNLPAVQTPGQIGTTVALNAGVFRQSDGTPLVGQPVLFSVDGDPAGLAHTDASGWATFPYLIPERGGAGQRYFVATYLGAPMTYATRANWAQLDVLRAPTTLWTLDRVGTIGEPVIFRAYLRRLPDLSWLPDRLVDFSVDGTWLGTGETNPSGRADLPWIISDGPATRTILAEFPGDGAYDGSSATATLNALTHATRMVGVDREGPIGSYRILRSWLFRLDGSPVPGKVVWFAVDGTWLGADTTSPSGRAQVGYVIPWGGGAGPRPIHAEWFGDGGYLPSSCDNTLNVLRAAPYIWVHPRSVPAGGLARLYAYFRALPGYVPQEGKLVSFLVDGTWVADVHTGTGTAAGIARHDYVVSEPPGAHTIRCDFAGDAWVDPGFGTATLNVY